MGIGVQSKSVLTEDLGQTAKLVQDLISKDDIVIFSKTYCPYCKMAKEVSLRYCFPITDYLVALKRRKVFNTLNRKYTVIELDQREDGSAIQTVLGQMTGVRTVPRVFLRGQCIGGGNEIKALFESGHLVAMLK